MIRDKNPYIVFLSETRVTENIYDQELEIKGYNTVRCNSHTRYTGGVLIYIRKRINYEIISNTFTEGNWFLLIRILKGFRRGNFAVIYHSPSASDATFLKAFETWYELNFEADKLNIIVGDFNIDVSKCSTYSDKLMKLINYYGLKQLVNDYTRVTNVSKTLIDLILTNEYNIKAEVLNNYIISDHNTIVINELKNLLLNKEIHKDITSWKNYNKDDLQNLLRQRSWKLVNLYNFEMKTFMFHNLLSESVNRLVEKKTIKVKNNNKWYSEELKILRNEKDRAYEQFNFISDLSEINISEKDNKWKIYTEKRNNYSNELKKAYNEYIQNQIEINKCDPKKLWTLLKEMLKQKQSEPDCIKFDGQLVQNNNIISEKFNSYFIDSIMKIHNNIPAFTSNNLKIPYQSKEFKFKPVTTANVLAIIKQFKNKSCLENINKQVLLDSFEIIGPVLVSIINESLINGTVPECWKTSTVIPIAKVTGTIDCDKFRPINMMPLCEKLLECVVKQQLELYLEDNNIIVDLQSGFREKHSCETSINFILQIWKSELEQNKKVVTVFLDLARAFETLDQSLLLKKLFLYGIRGVEHNWFKSYLSNRTQVTKFKNVTSLQLATNIGVPQGTVLGPLLFILYINDINDSVNQSKLNCFADDTSISYAHNNTSVAIDVVNRDLENISDWLKFNKLKLNITKTKYMIISSKNVVCDNGINIDGEIIERVKIFKYLGIIIDYQLKFKQNAEYVAKKMAKKVNILARLSKQLFFWSKVSIYVATVLPHIDYCSSILFLLTREDTVRLQKIQNRAMRLILKCRRDVKIEVMLEKLNWLSVNQRIQYNCLILIYKIQNGMLPKYLNHQICYNRDISPYNTRNKDNFRLPQCTKSQTQNSVYYKGLQQYNNLPTNIKTEVEITKFKDLLYQHIQQSTKIIK